MTDLTSLIERFKSALKRAEQAGLRLPNGGTLATVGPGGLPSSRVVLLKDADEQGFVFYTNLESRKSRELRANPSASICFWWPSLEQQVRVEGGVEPVTDAEADAYWETRARSSQIGAWASRQSEPLASRDDLVCHFDRVQQEYSGRSVPRPPHWSGFRLVPERIEFWTGHEDRLHERELFTRTGSSWEKTLLSP
jgi:pyridoxamine 5'-phosphate oxidase